MKIYKVGGCVRDHLLGWEPKDTDYVVVGSSPAEMRSLGYKQVGADFPVFLHPETNDEYALARTEKKTYTGYCGFTSNWEGVTLEEDLSRRDLTINSMAMDDDGNIIDPFNGQRDLKYKRLRHTSEAFSEDPVRVLRLARFHARLGSEWSVSAATFHLCTDLARSEFSSLTKERVWAETQKTLSEPHPELYFKFLRSVGEHHWFQELWDQYDIPQPIAHHPENWVFKHTMLCLQQGVRAGATPEEMFAILCHDLGKPPCWKERGNLHGHEDTGIPYVEALCDRLGVPKSYRNLAIKVCKWHQYGHRILDVQPKKVHKLFKGLDCIKNPSILDSFLVCNVADARGRTGFEDRDYPQARYLEACLGAVLEVDTKAVAKEAMEAGAKKEAIGERIRIAQINAIRGIKNGWE